MHILVTGGLGLVGRPLVDHLLHLHHGVRVLDRGAAIPQATESILPGAEVFIGDTNDFASVRRAVQGIDAVVHLAAIPNPGGGAGHEIFRINCAGTFNVYEAAAQEGIRRVVCASSINALGFNFGIKSFPIQYLPIDEEHPTFTSDPYSFSKGITEEIAAYYWRREGISGVQLRLPGVLAPSEEFREMVLKFDGFTRQAIEKVLQMPLAARQERARQLIAEMERFRAERMHEKPHPDESPDMDWSPDLNDPLGWIAFGYTDFWADITTTDSARAFELALLADYQGSHPLFVADAVNMVNMDAEFLASAFFPEAARKRALVGREPLVSCDKARQLIGFEPRPAVDEWLQQSR